jgi:Rho-binding antiterminator
MTVMTQDDVGRCDFIDVLEEAVLRKRPVAVTMRDRSTFIDTVVDVVTENGDEFVVFRAHARTPVGDIFAVTRAEPVS